MPLPTPNKGEKQDEFMNRCMSNETMKSDFPDNKQRLAVCFSQAKKRADDPDLEQRMVVGSDLRVATGQGLRQKLIGHAIVFNQLSETLLFFREQIAPEAVDRTFVEGIDVRALVDHDPAKILGRLTARTLKLSKDDQGLLVEIEPPDTTYARDVVESVRRGDVSGMSFAFRALKDSWNEREDPPIRTVTDMRVSEVSLVTFPAYPATDVGVAQRSLERFRAEHPPIARPKVSVLRERLRQAAG
jgi:HK97 family phage prohead protease